MIENLNHYSSQTAYVEKYSKSVRLTQVANEKLILISMRCMKCFSHRVRPVNISTSTSNIVQCQQRQKNKTRFLNK